VSQEFPSFATLGDTRPDSRGQLDSHDHPDLHGHPVRLLVVDDHAGYRAAVSDWFSIHEDVDTVVQADSVRSALVALDRSTDENSQVDLVVMDVHMPVTNGIDGALEMLRRYTSVRVALCSTSEPNQLPELSTLPVETGRVTFFEKGDLEPDKLMSWFRESFR
jgi:chemotaxis response regulator CheB